MHRGTTQPELQALLEQSQSGGEVRGVERGERLGETGLSRTGFRARDRAAQ
jgi:hypothetical protein